MSENRSQAVAGYLPILLGRGLTGLSSPLSPAQMESVVADAGGFLQAIDDDAREAAPLTAERLARAKIAYSVHAVPEASMATVVTGRITPSPGDLVLARIASIGQHARIELRSGRRARLFIGDEVIVCYGHRYAPDQFEAEVPYDLEECSLVAAGGIAARVCSRHKSMKKATRLSPVGLLGDSHGRPLNLKDFALAPVSGVRAVPTVAVVGTSMNSGKTTTAASLIHGLTAAGYRVGSAKVTGTGAGGDVWHATDSGAAVVLDFTHAGVPSTYLLSEDSLIRVFETLVGTLAAANVDAIVLEVADGLYQRETAMILRSALFRDHVDGVLFAAADALGAVAGTQWLANEGIAVKGVSGCLTASALAIQETSAAVGVPILDRNDLMEPECAAELLDLELPRAVDLEIDPVAASSLALAG